MRSVHTAAPVQSPKISVIFATRNRASILEQTLLAMKSQAPHDKWELVVVDNASTDRTPNVLAAMREHLPLRILYHPQPGKSSAMNRALTAALGQLIAFTDDDIRPETYWLSAYERAYHERPIDILCGPISGQFPKDSAPWLETCPHASPLFARFEPASVEYLLPPDLLPFGGNFAVRAERLRGIFFDESLGPPHRLMGEDTKFLLELRRYSQEILYIPAAGVKHHIRPEQLAFHNIVDRAFTCGSSMIGVMDTMDIVPSLPSGGSLEATQFNLAADLNYTYGQLAELSARGRGDRREQTLMKHIVGLGWSGDSALLAEQARSWLTLNPRFVPNEAKAAFWSTATAKSSDVLDQIMEAST